MPLRIEIANNANDPVYSSSIIAHEAFTVKCSRTDQNGNIDPTYNGTIDIYANDSAGNKRAYKIGTGTAVSGYVEITPRPITQVYGNQGITRVVTGVNSLNEESSVTVSVWQRVIATQFNGEGGACGTGLPDYYVALPVLTSYVPCGANVYVQYQGVAKMATRQDVGPWVPRGDCGPDPYWNTGTRPFAEIHQDKLRCDVCNIDCQADGNLRFNGAGIDLSTKLMQALGGSGKITVLWRFR